MSRRDLRLFLLSGENAMVVETYDESWRCGPLLWRLMSERYLGQLPGQFFTTAAAHDTSLWHLCRNRDVPRHLRVCLAWTGARQVVGVQNADVMARYCVMTHVDILGAGMPGAANGEPLWEQLATDLHRYSRELNTRRGDAFALGCKLAPWGDQWLDPLSRVACFNAFGYADLGGRGNDPGLIHEGLRDLDLGL